MITTNKSVEVLVSEEESSELDELSLSMLVNFFQLLDQWEREAENNAKVM